MDADYRSSLVRRLRAVHTLYGACSSMSLEPVNAVPDPRALPIAFSPVHQVLIEDRRLVFVGGPRPLFTDQWARRIVLAVAGHSRAKTVEKMMRQRIGDVDALREFQ